MRSRLVAALVLTLTLAASPALASTVSPNVTPPEPPNGKATFYNDTGSVYCANISRYSLISPWNDLCIRPGVGIATTAAFGARGGTTTCWESYYAGKWHSGEHTYIPAGTTRTWGFPWGGTWSVRYLPGDIATCPKWGGAV